VAGSNASFSTINFKMMCRSLKEGQTVMFFKKLATFVINAYFD